MDYFMLGLKRLTAAILAALLAACAGKSQAPPKAEEQFSRPEPMTIRGPVEYALKARAGTNVNRDDNGKPLSIVVRVYQLKDKNEFARLTFDRLVNCRSDAELFPNEFVAVREVVLLPGAVQESTEKLLPETRYVGVTAFFRRPDTQGWRFLVDAGTVAREGLNYMIGDCTFDGIQPRPESLPGEAAGHAPKCGGNVRPAPGASP